MICKNCYNANDINILDGEIFVPYKGFEEYILVSNFGRIILQERDYNNKTICYKKKRLAKLTTNNHGYKRFVLHINNNHHSFLVHRLVAKMFIENPLNLPCVNHKDENKGNNYANNLEWCDHKYNNNYGTRNKRISIANKGICTPKMKTHLDAIKDKMKIPIAQFDLNGNFVQAFESISEGQRSLNNNSIFSMFCRGKNISKGYRFEKISKECFLALAAMRDDTDKDQLFTNGIDWAWYRDDTDKGGLAGFEFYYLQRNMDTPLHKATEEEILNCFQTPTV